MRRSLPAKRCWPPCTKVLSRGNCRLRAGHARTGVEQALRGPAQLSTVHASRGGRVHRSRPLPRCEGEYGPGDREELVDARVSLIDLERPQDFERIRPQGTVFEVRSRPMAGGGIVLTYLDVTAARRREAEKEQARATLRGVFDSSLDGIMAFEALRSQDGKIRDFRWIQVNPACETLTGRDPNELVGRCLLEEMPENASEWALCSLLRCRREASTGALRT